MSHEMTRREAREEGYDVDDLAATVPAADPDDDVVNVWAQLPDADTFTPEQLDDVEVGVDAPEVDAEHLEDLEPARAPFTPADTAEGGGHV